MKDTPRTNSAMLSRGIIAVANLCEELERENEILKNRLNYLKSKMTFEPADSGIGSWIVIEEPVDSPMLSLETIDAFIDSQNQETKQ